MDFFDVCAAMRQHTVVVFMVGGDVCTVGHIIGISMDGGSNTWRLDIYPVTGFENASRIFYWDSRDKNTWLRLADRQNG